MAQAAPRYVAALAVATLLLTGCGAQPDTAPDEPEQSESATQSAALADLVWSDVEAYYPDGFPTDDLLAGVNKVEDAEPGTIRVYVQFELTDAEREQVANDVHGLGYTEGLETVVIQDATGLDSNHFFN